MVSRGHSYNDIIHVYPYELVVLLMHGVALNRRIEQVEMAHAMTIAVSDVMDRAFGKGKGKILEKWTDEMLNEMTPEERKKQVFTKESLKILGKMPVAVVKKKE